MMTSSSHKLSQDETIPLQDTPAVEAFVRQNTVYDNNEQRWRINAQTPDLVRQRNETRPPCTLETSYKILQIAHLDTLDRNFDIMLDAMETKTWPSEELSNREYQDVIRVDSNVVYPQGYMFIHTNDLHPLPVFQYVREMTLARGRILYEVHVSKSLASLLLEVRAKQRKTGSVHHSLFRVHLSSTGLY